MVKQVIAVRLVTTYGILVVFYKNIVNCISIRYCNNYCKLLVLFSIFIMPIINMNISDIFEPAAWIQSPSANHSTKRI